MGQLHNGVELRRILDGRTVCYEVVLRTVKRARESVKLRPLIGKKKETLRFDVNQWGQ